MAMTKAGSALLQVFGALLLLGSLGAFPDSSTEALSSG